MLKRILAAMLLFCLLVQPAQAQDGFTTYFPIITKGNGCELMSDPILRVTDGMTVIDLLGPGSGWQLADPYWQPQIAQFKGGGAFVDSGLAEGKQLVHKEYDNVIETIPLSVTGVDQGAAIQTIRDLLQLGRQSSDYWTESYEYDDVWLEVKPACANSLTGYSRIIKMSIPNLNNIFGQPFFSAYAQPVMEDLTLIIEREPFWRGTPPGEMIGPLYNLIKNPDFELWNFGTGDSQPDNWNDLESLWITGENSRDNKPQWGNYALKVRVSGSTQAGAVKGITQALENTEDKTEYTVIAWVRSSGVSNGVGRVLVNYSSQLELYRSSDQHGWKLYADKITTGLGDIVSINCEILTTAANTDGTVYFDGLLLLKGDWVEEAKNGVLPYISSSGIYNREDTLLGTLTPGAINWLDVWNVPGDVDSPVRLEVINNTGGSTPPDFEQIIIGQRRTGNIFNLENNNDVIGVADATGSSQTSKAISSLNSSWQQQAIDFISSPAITKDNVGRYRLYARLYDNKATSPLLLARARYFIGTSGIHDKILDEIRMAAGQKWSLVNLTENAAINFDSKFQSEYPSQIGYSIELKRDDGTTTGAKLDYSLLMPTDGGFMDVKFDPLLPYGAALLVDNTNSVTISSFQKSRSTWVPLFTDGYAPAGVHISRVALPYNDYLYMSTEIAVPANGVRVIKFKSGETPMTNTVTGISVNSVSVAFKKIYKDNLYVFSDGGDLYKFNLNSLSFLNFYSAVAGGTFIMGVEVLGDYLYTWANIFPGATSMLNRFDGTNNITIANYATSGIQLSGGIKAYNGFLFMGTNSGVFKYDPSTGNTTNTGGPTGIRNFEVWNGSLYAASIATGTYLYNGTGWTLLTTKAGVTLVAYGTRLYLSSNTAVYYTENGTDWLDETGLIGIVPNANYNNLLVGTPRTGPVNLIAYYAVISNAIDYGVSSYQGIPFHSPSRNRDNEKRHRYFFIANRSGSENNIDDKMLVGIGFVPRYLSLINYNPQ